MVTVLYYKCSTYVVTALYYKCSTYVFNVCKTSTYIVTVLYYECSTYVVAVLHYMCNIYVFYFCCGAATQRRSWPPHIHKFSRSHTQRNTTVARTPLDK